MFFYYENGHLEQRWKSNMKDVESWSWNDHLWRENFDWTRVALLHHLIFPSTMAKATEFDIAVQSDDPKKKDQPEDKNKAEGSSKQSKDGKKDTKEDEGEELVCNTSWYLLALDLTSYLAVRRRPSTEKWVGDASATAEGM